MQQNDSLADGHRSYIARVRSHVDKAELLGAVWISWLRPRLEEQTCEESRKAVKSDERTVEGR